MNTSSTDTVALPEVDEVPTRSLNQLEDRCDRCGSEAWFIAISPEQNDRSGEDSELMFCGHHGKKHLPVLRERNFKILDFSEGMEEKYSVFKAASDGDAY